MSAPKLRFKDGDGKDFPDWETCTLRDISDRVKRKNSENNQNVLTISAQQGLVNQKEYFTKSVSAKDVTKYFLLEANDFAYNKSYSNGYPFGAIKRLKLYQKGVVSTLYICFKFKDGCEPSFFEHYFDSGIQNQSIGAIAQEGARNHGLLNIGIEDFFGISIDLPHQKEQNKIASFLSLVDQKISNLTKKHELLLQYKKGVMQKIFNQEIRFKDKDGKDFPEWEERKFEDVVQIQGGYAFKSALFGVGVNKVLKIGDINPYISLRNFTGEISTETPDVRFSVQKGDYLMALSGATFGKVGKIIDDGIAFINQRVATFRTTQINEFFYQFIQSDRFIKYINSIPSASAQPNISNADIGRYSAPIPSIGEQQKIASLLSSIDQKIKGLGSKIELTKQYKQGLLQQMFI